MYTGRHSGELPDAAGGAVSGLSCRRGRPSEPPAGMASNHVQKH
jgi:hypothetical protein